ncbi:hypothetical protein D3Z17_05400 [Bacillus subtilis]|nr:hypothetical protein QF06_04190 [Bacillus sp. YP1]ASB98839.1 hypothetical protein CD007_05610 [Bacillus subtilis]AXF32340.1 hypothetical protein DS740_05620 [Bacillus sp. DM2]KMY42020.1 hypothetical protein AC621_10805 [Bacillus sp. FJAT-27445]QAT74048.1 hypothetical protein D9C22_05625 [Bacillus sp. WR11]GIN81548.1 hypothetical protein J5TS4_21260 [Bacillus sp. J5TS4]
MYKFIYIEDTLSEKDQCFQLLESKIASYLGILEISDQFQNRLIHNELLDGTASLQKILAS